MEKPAGWRRPWPTQWLRNSLAVMLRCQRPDSSPNGARLLQVGNAVSSNLVNRRHRGQMPKVQIRNETQQFYATGITAPALL